MQNRAARRRTADPFIRRSTLRFLTQGETPSVRAVAAQLHFGMVRALQDGTGAIHATWREVAEWSGISYASVKRAVTRLRELGWVKELEGHRIVFDYSRSCPARPVEKAQFEPSPSSIRENPTGRDETHPSSEVPTGLVASPASGADGLSPEPMKAQELPQMEPVAELVGEDVGSRPVGVSPSGKATDCQSAIHPEPKKPSLIGQAVAAMVQGGADRAGAVKAAKLAKQYGHLDLSRVRAIAEAVQALPAGSSYRPAGLLCAAVRRPELGAKLLRDHQRQVRRSELAAHNRLVVGSTPTGAIEQTTNRLLSGRSNDRSRDYETLALTPRAGSAWNAALATVRGWATMGLEGREDLGFWLAKNPTITPDHVRAAMPAWSAWL